MIAVTPEDVQWLIDTNQLPSIRLRNKVLILAQEVEDLLQTYTRVQNRTKEIKNAKKTTR